MPTNVTLWGGFFRGDLIGKGDEPEGFARGHSPKLSERSPLAEYRRYPTPANVTLWGGFFRGDLIGKGDEPEGFARGAIATTLSAGSLLRVSEFPS